MKLYEIRNDYFQILEAYRHADNEIDASAYAEALNEIEDTLEGKLENCCKAMRNYECEIAAYDCEIDRLIQQRQSIEAKVRSVRNYIDYTLMAIKGPEAKVKAGTFALCYRAAVSVEVIDEEQLDPRYRTEKVTSAPNKKAIREDIQAGIEVPGAKLVTNYRMQIK